MNNEDEERFILKEKKFILKSDKNNEYEIILSINNNDILNITVNAMKIPIRDVIRYRIIVLPPTVKILLISESEDTPTTREQKTSGTTSIFISLIKIFPPK